MPSNRARSDTAPEAQATHARVVAQLSAAERVQRARDLTLTANALALAGLRRRHPAAGERELLLRLAALRLGADVVERAYGWRAPADDA
jgi:hypothetical protein